MSYTRINHRPDSNKLEVVEAIRKAGYVVDDDLQVDLCVRHPNWVQNTFIKFECKTLNRKDRFAPRKGQKKQTEYCNMHGVPYVFSAEEALKYLRMYDSKYRP